MPTGATSASWSQERRKRASQLIHQWKPWTKSTGPKTVQGKAIVANNALKHGRDCRAVWTARKVASEMRRLETELERKFDVK